MTFAINIADLLAVKVNAERIHHFDRCFNCVYGRNTKPDYLCGDAKLVIEYANRPTPFPAIQLLHGRDVIRDGLHRVAAAILRGDTSIMAVELADDSQALRKANAEQ